MMLMEAELASLKQDKLQLQQQLDTVNRSLVSAVEQLTQQTVDINQTLTQRWSDLEAIQQRDKASLSHMIQGGCSGPVLTVWCTPQTGVGASW